MNNGVLFLQVEPTTRCNFRCKFCAGRHFPQTDLKLELFELAIRLFPGIRHLELQGEGEPLLHPGFFDMLRVTNSLQPDTKLSTITNGSLFTDKNIEPLLDCGLHSIQISIESADPAVFHQMRGGRLEKVVEGVRAFMAARKQRGATTPAVGFAVTVLRRTLYEMPRIIALYESLGLDGRIGTQPLQPMGAYTCYYGDQTMLELPSAGDMDTYYRRLWQNPRAERVLKRPLAAIDFFPDLFSDWRPSIESCRWLTQALYISADGTVTSCCFQKNADLNKLGVLGQSSAQTLLDNRRRLATALRRGTPPPGCLSCPLADQVLAESRQHQTPS